MAPRRSARPPRVARAGGGSRPRLRRRAGAAARTPVRLAAQGRPREARRLRLSPEAAARHVRYAALAEIAAETGSSLIATAHQGDDVLESHLIAVRRRGGVSRLGGPRERRGDGVVRPLLRVSRAEILDFLAARSLPYRRDATNGDLRLSRNRARRDIAAMDEAARREMSERVSAYRDQTRRLEEEFAAAILPSIRQVGNGVEADASRLQEADEELRRLAIDRLGVAIRPARPPARDRPREGGARPRLGSGRFPVRGRATYPLRAPRSRLSIRPAPGVSPEIMNSCKIHEFTVDPLVFAGATCRIEREPGFKSSGAAGLTPGSSAGAACRIKREPGSKSSGVQRLTPGCRCTISGKISTALMAGTPPL